MINFKTLLITLALLLPGKALANDQALCISTAIYYEARGSTHQDRVGVASVIMNRVRDSRFPNTPCGVVMQRNQFSWTNGRWSHQSMYLPLARSVLNGEILDNTNNSLYFWSVRIPTPSWARNKRTQRIGSHYYAR